MLPRLADAAHFDRLLRADEIWTTAVATIAERHDLDGPFARSPTGSTVVALSDACCIKLHPPLPPWTASCRRESAALRHTEGKLAVATPRVLAQGQLEGWPYFVATRVPGRPIDEVWPSASRGERVRWAAQLGEAIAGLHALPEPDHADLTCDWPTFVAEQRARALPRERQRGLAPERCEELEAYLSDGDRTELSARRALLHTEIGPAHTYVQGDRVSGLIDFGDAMVGDPEYDIAAVGLFVTQGDAAAFAEFSRAYGCDAHQLAEPQRRHRLLRHALLHRYGTLHWYQDRLRPPAGSVAALAEHWFGVAQAG